DGNVCDATWAAAIPARHSPKSRALPRDCPTNICLVPRSNTSSLLPDFRQAQELGADAQLGSFGRPRIDFDSHSGVFQLEIDDSSVRRKVFRLAHGQNAAPLK